MAIRDSKMFKELRAVLLEKLNEKKKDAVEERDKKLLQLYLDLGTTRKVAKRLKMPRTTVELRLQKFDAYRNHYHHRNKKVYTSICLRCGVPFTHYKKYKRHKPKFCCRAHFFVSSRSPEQNEQQRLKTQVQNRERAKRWYYKNIEKVKKAKRLARRLKKQKTAQGGSLSKT